jgi:ribokinase
MEFEPDGVEVPPVPRGETWVALFQNEIPRQTTEALIRKTHTAGCVVMWNIAPTIGRQPGPEILQCVDYLVCNKNEIQALVGAQGDFEELAKKPLAWGVKNVIVTLGRNGSIWAAGQSVHQQASYPVESIDAVGAGDCFCGVLAAGIASGSSVETAMRRASAAAAISTTRRGAQPSMPASPEIEDFLKSRA